MPGIIGNPNPSVRIVSGALNTENNPAVGVPLASPSGSIVQAYTGNLGIKWALSEDQALLESNTAVGTLYNGVYQLVQLAATNVANLARGRLVFWNPAVAADLYQVNQLESANGGQPLFAGVLINSAAYLTAGNFVWIQVAGKATVQIRGTVTSGTRNIIWAAAGAGADNATFDGLANATAITGANLWGTRMAIGEAVAASGALVIADLLPTGFVTRQ